MKTIAATILALCFLMPVVTFAQDATPPAAEIKGPDPQIAEERRTKEFLWGEDAAMLLDEAGGESVWKPVSVRFRQEDDEFYVFAEVVNTSEDDLVAPSLMVELLIEGESYGVEDVSPVGYWIPAGESAFFEVGTLYSGSIQFGDWDEERFFIEETTFYSPEDVDTTGIRLEGDRVYNDRDSRVPEVRTSSIIRDGAGVYTASCFGPYTGAAIPPGRSVRLSGSISSSDLPRCGFSVVGFEASEALGYGEPYSVEHIISSFGS